jgi:hypothetical protein
MAQSIAKKTTVQENLGSIPSKGFSEDGFSGEPHLPSFCDSFHLKKYSQTCHNDQNKN